MIAPRGVYVGLNGSKVPLAPARGLRRSGVAAPRAARPTGDPQSFDSSTAQDRAAGQQQQQQQWYDGSAAPPAAWGYVQVEPDAADATAAVTPSDTAAAATVASSLGAATAGPGNALLLPLDHYVALGLPVHAGSHLIRRALEQMQASAPVDVGYSQDTLFAREQLIKSAADCLLDRRARDDYDAHLAAQHAAAGPDAPICQPFALRDAPAALALLTEAGDWGTVLSAADELLGTGDRPTVAAQGPAALFAARGSSGGRPGLTSGQRRDIAVAGAVSALSAASAVADGKPGSPTAARAALDRARARLAREAGNSGGGAIESLLLRLRALSADLAVAVVEEHLAAPLPAAADPTAAAGRAQALRCLSGLLFGQGDHARLEGRARDHIVQLTQRNLTAAEQVELYEGAPPGTVVPPAELHATALALLAEGWRRAQPLLVRRARRLLEAVAEQGGSDGTYRDAEALAACATLLDGSDATDAEQAATARSGVAAWLEGAVLGAYPECWRVEATGEVEGAQGAQPPIDLERNWFAIPHVAAIVKVVSTAPGEKVLEFFDSAGAAAQEALAPLKTGDAAQVGAAAADAARAAAGQAGEAAARWAGDAGRVIGRAVGADPDAPAGARNMRGVYGWGAVAAIGLAAFALATAPSERRRAAAAAAAAPAAVDAAIDPRARPSARALPPVPTTVSASAVLGALTRGGASTASSAPLSQSDAAALLSDWHAARRAALGPEHDAAALEAVACGELLASWKEQAMAARLRAEHFEIEVRGVEVEAVESGPGGRTFIQAAVSEAGRQYLGGTPVADFESRVTLAAEAARDGPDGGWKLVRVAPLPPVAP